MATRYSSGWCDAGETLARLLDAQRRDHESASRVTLRRSAKALTAYARELDMPRLEPVSPSGNRLTGAALVLDGELRLRRHGDAVNDTAILLVDGVTVTYIPLVAHAQRMRAAGAARVWAFAVDAPAEPPGPDLDGIRVMSLRT